MKKYLLLLLFALFGGGGFELQADPNPKDTPKPTSMLDSALVDLLSLQDSSVALDGSPMFPVSVDLAVATLNLVAMDQPAHDIMYTPKIDSYITDAKDEKGNFYYTAVQGTEKTLLGYSKYYNFYQLLDTALVTKSSSTNNGAITENSNNNLGIKSGSDAAPTTKTEKPPFFSSSTPSESDNIPWHQSYFPLTSLICSRGNALQGEFLTSWSDFWQNKTFPHFGYALFKTIEMATFIPVGAVGMIDSFAADVIIDIICGLLDVVNYPARHW